MTPSPARPHTPHRRRSAVGLAAAALAVALAGSGCAALFGDTGADELEQFLTALETGDHAAAAALTTDPAGAEEALALIIPSEPRPSVSAETPEGDDRPDSEPVAIEYTWDFGTAGQNQDDDGDDDNAGDAPAEPEDTSDAEAPEQSRTVVTTGEARTTKVGEEWKVEWAPTVLDTRLAPGGYLSFTPLLDYDTNVTDRTGAPLMQWTPVTAVTLAALLEVAPRSPMSKSSPRPGNSWARAPPIVSGLAFRSSSSSTRWRSHRSPRPRTTRSTARSSRGLIKAKRLRGQLSA